MATITFVRPDPDAYVATPRIWDEDKALPADQPPVTVFMRHPGGPDELQLVEVRHSVGHRTHPHAHEVDEIFVVTEGEIHFGSQIYGVGSSIYIPKLTLYSFRAGPEGVTYLKFTPKSDMGIVTKEELMARRGDAKLAASAES